MRSAALILFTACATTSSTGDVHSIESAVQARTHLEVELPRFDDADTDAAGLEGLLDRPLDADTAVRIALLNNREARAALADVGIARGNLVTAGLLPNPTVEFEARDPGGPQPVQIDIGVDLDFAAMILAPLRSHAAEATLEAERLHAAGALLDLVWRTRIAFYEVQAREAQLELQVRGLENVQAAFATAQELARVGNLRALDVATQLAAVESARVKTAEAETTALMARERLTRMLGVSGTTTRWTIGTPLEVPTVPLATDFTEKRAIATSLELAELQSRAEASSRTVGLTRSEGVLPSLSAGFHGERDGNLWELGAHVAIGLPVFDRAQGRRVAAQSQYDGWRQRAEVTAVHVRSLLRITFSQAESASRRAHHFAERLVPARQRALHESLLQYNAMELSVFDLLSAQRAVTETALEQVDATLDAWRARASLVLLMSGRSTPLEDER